jgi:hypothetical protein
MGSGRGVHSATLYALALYCESSREIYFSIPHSAEKALNIIYALAFKSRPSKAQQKSSRAGNKIFQSTISAPMQPSAFTLYRVARRRRR